jgi:hypothetical protein
VHRKVEKAKRLKLDGVVAFVASALEDSTDGSAGKEYSSVAVEGVLQSAAMASVVKSAVQQGLHDRIHNVPKQESVSFQFIG